MFFVSFGLVHIEVTLFETILFQLFSGVVRRAISFRYYRRYVDLCEEGLGAGHFLYTI